MPHTNNEDDLSRYMEKNEKEYSSFDYVTTRMLSVLLDLPLLLKRESQLEESERNVCNAIKEMRESARDEGRDEGKELKLIGQVCKKLRKDKEWDVIADEVEEDIQTISRICEVAAAFAPDYDVEKIYKALHEDED